MHHHMPPKSAYTAPTPAPRRSHTKAVDGSTPEGGTLIQARAVPKGKMKIVKKIVKVLVKKKVVVKKKVIVKKRVHIRDSVEKARKGAKSNEETEKSSNLANDAGAKSSFQLDEVKLGSKIVDEVEEKPSLVDGVTGKVKREPFARRAESGFDFVKEAEGSKVGSGGARGIELDVVGEKGNMSCAVDPNSSVGAGVAQNVHAQNVHAQKVHAQKVACEKDNAKDVKILNDARNPGSVGAGNINCAAESKAFKAVYVSNKGDLRNVGDKRGNDAIQNRETNSTVVLNEALLLSGEMERMKRSVEIFVGGLDKGTTEEDIRNVFGEFGKIVEVRLVPNGKTGKQNCSAFVRFASADGVDNALRKYSKVEIRGNMCDVSPAEGNTIYLGHTDRNWKNADVVQLLEKAGTVKMDRVVLKDDPYETGKNHGFAFVIFETSKDAEIAFRKLGKESEAGKLNIKVEWAQFFKPRKQMKHVVGTQATMRPNEPRNKRKRAGSSHTDCHANVHTGSFTTDRFVHSFRPQPTTNYIPPPPPPIIVPSFPDQRFPLPGTYRPFPFMGQYDPRYMERRVLPPQPFGTSHPNPGQRASFNCFSTPPFPYYRPQRPGFTSGWNMYPSHFQTNVQAAAPHYGNHSSYPTN